MFDPCPRQPLSSLTNCGTATATYMVPQYKGVMILLFILELSFFTLLLVRIYQQDAYGYLNCDTVYTYAAKLAIEVNWWVLRHLHCLNSSANGAVRFYLSHARKCLLASRNRFGVALADLIPLMICEGNENSFLWRGCAILR
jgi:hypothetical protein